MSNATVKIASSAAEVTRQIRKGKAALKVLKASLEDLEDHQTPAAAKQKNGRTPTTALREFFSPGGER